MKNIICLLTLLLVYINVNATDYYFSMMTGDDANAGTQASPKKSLSAAQSLCTTGNRIYFKRGETWYGSLTIQGSGTSGTRVVVGAWGTGANPIITGFTDVTSWTNLGGNIWESTSAVSTLSTLKMVTFNGVNIPVGSFPNPATTAMSPLPSVHPIPGNGGWRNFQTRYCCSPDDPCFNTSSACTTPTGWWINDTYLTGSPNWNGGQVVIKTVNWVLDVGTITSHSGQRVNYTPTAWDGGEYSQAYEGMSYFIQDHPSVLSYQHSWYYDKSTKKLKIYSTTMPTGIKVASVQTLVNGNNRSYISFENINFVGSNSDMILPSDNSSYWNFTDCTFEFAGRDAVYTNWMSYSNFLRCTIKDAANNGIMYREGCTNNTFVDNVVLRVGVFAGQNDQSRWFSGEGIHSIGDNNTFTGNNVRYVGLNGIRFGGSNVMVNKNFISNYCYTKSDGGSIYAWGVNGGQNWSNIYIQDNICDSGSLRGSIGTWLENQEIAVKGIYLDATMKNVTIQRNSVGTTVGAGIYLNNPLNTTVRYNTVFDARYAALHLNRYVGQGTMNFKATGNILVAKKLGSGTAGGKNPPTQNNQRTFYWKSDNVDDMSSAITTLDSNIYARPMDDFTTGVGSNEVTNMTNIKSISKTIYNGSFTGSGEYAPQYTYGLAAFKSAYPSWNQNSKISPVAITDTSKLRFEYNWSSGTRNINLGATYVDMNGTSYSSITLQPYTSVVLINTGAATTPPTCSAGTTPVTITLPTSTVALSGSGNSTTGGTVSFLWTKPSGGAATITSPTSASTNATGLTAGAYTFRLTVTDNTSGLTCISNKSVTVNPAVVMPTANAGVDQSITLPTNFVTVTGAATGTSPLNYEWRKVFGGAATIDFDTGLSTDITGMVAGVYRFEFKVTDGNNNIALDTIQITVLPASNIPPTANAGANQVITLPSNATLSGSGTDTDGTIVSYLWTKITGGSANIVSSASQVTQVNGLSAGVYTFELRVTDNNGAFGRDTMQLTVNAAPQVPPIARAGNDVVIQLPTNSAALNGSGSTAGSSPIVSYAWIKLTGTGGSITSPSSVSTSATGLSAGVYTYKLTVTDANTLSSSDTMQITVNAAAIQPTANAGADQIITLPINYVTVNGIGTGTVPLNYEWRKLTGGSATITFDTGASTDIIGLSAGVYTFEFKVTDNASLVARDTIIITVKNAPTTDSARTIIEFLQATSVRRTIYIEWESKNVNTNSVAFHVESKNFWGNYVSLIKLSPIAGVTKYFYQDKNPSNGYNYYRVRVTDKDAVTYSNVVGVKKK